MRIVRVAPDLAEAQPLAVGPASRLDRDGLSPCNSSICCEKIRKLHGFYAEFLFVEDMQ